MKKSIPLSIILFFIMFNLFGQGKKKSNNQIFKFKEDESTACFTCDHVLSRTHPILYASHDSNGEWQFMCGQEGHTDANAKIISLKQAIEIDPTINELFDMPVGVGAERETIKDKWKAFRLE